MKNLNDFEEEKNSLLQKYDLILSLDLVPIGEITEQSILDKKKSLEDERFIVSICGQMKSGKSTLLNALLFGEQILPADDTVMTAKITSIRHDSTSRFEVHFYNENEWNKLRYDFAKEPNFQDQFEKDISSCLEQGIYYEEVISIERKIQHVAGIDQLLQYVALPKAGGKFTPFVKDVVVYHNNPWLKDVVVVDTPGINDPNELRANITKQWIHNANAVLFVTYAGQALAEPDVEFIDTYLLHVPSNNRIIVVNKIDCVNLSEVESSIQDLREHGDTRVKSIFGKNASIAYVSALAGLLESMIEKQKMLTDDEEELREILEDKNYLDPKKHNIPSLQELIEITLIKNKGSNVLQSHKEFITSLFQRNIHAVEQFIFENKESLTLLNKNNEQLQQEEVKIKHQQVGLSSLFNKFKDELALIINKKATEIHTTINQIKQAVLDESTREIHRIQNTSHFANEVSWIVKTAIEKKQEFLFDRIDEIRSELSALLEKQIYDLRNILESKELISIGLLNTIITSSTYELFQDIENATKIVLNTTEIQKLVDEHTWFFQRWFDTQGGIDNVRSALRNKLQEFGEKTFNESFTKKVIAALESKIQNSKSALENEINMALNKKKEQIREIQTTQESREKQKQMLKENLQRLESRLKQLQNQKDSIQ